jgi:GNAT superfamily N-acetyltransferase
MLRTTIEDFLGIKKNRDLNEPHNNIKLKNLLNFKNPFHDETEEIIQTKRNEPVLLVKPRLVSQEGVETFKLITFTFGCLECFKIHFNIDTDKQEIEIIDVVVIRDEFHHKGYGTLLIQEVINHGRKIGIKRIYGNMVNDSYEHHQRQIAFYSKNGFTLFDNNYKFEMFFNEI